MIKLVNSKSSYSNYINNTNINWDQFFEEGNRIISDSKEIFRQNAVAVNRFGEIHNDPTATFSGKNINQGIHDYYSKIRQLVKDIKHAVTELKSLKTSCTNLVNQIDVAVRSAGIAMPPNEINTLYKEITFIRNLTIDTIPDSENFYKMLSELGSHYQDTSDEDLEQLDSTSVIKYWEKLADDCNRLLGTSHLLQKTVNGLLPGLQQLTKQGDRKIFSAGQGYTSNMILNTVNTLVDVLNEFESVYSTSSELRNKIQILMEHDFSTKAYKQAGAQLLESIDEIDKYYDTYVRDYHIIVPEIKQYIIDNLANR